MSKLTLLPGHNFEALNDFAGNENLMAYWDPTTFELEMPGIDQATADQALIDYAADQATIDADWVDKKADQAKDRKRDEFDEKDDLTALIKAMVDELNVLRALHALPDLNFGQVNASIRSRIGNP
jgi:hypothetical protein